MELVGLLRVFGFEFALFFHQLDLSCKSYMAGRERYRFTKASLASLRDDSKLQPVNSFPNFEFLQ